MLLRSSNCRPRCNLDWRSVVDDEGCFSISFLFEEDAVVVAVAVVVVVRGCFTSVIVTSINRDEPHEKDKTKDVRSKGSPLFFFPLPKTSCVVCVAPDMISILSLSLSFCTLSVITPFFHYV